MIYIIEINYTDPQSEGEWNAWYDGYLREMVTVPGIETAQRFAGENEAARSHLAVYTLAGLSVYEEPRYRQVGGGGFASAKWKANIKRRRNLYEGVDRVPEISDAARLVITEQDPATLDPPDVLFVPIQVKDMSSAQADAGHSLSRQVPFDNDPAKRWVAIVPSQAAAAIGRQDKVAVYRPSSPRVTGAK